MSQHEQLDCGYQFVDTLEYAALEPVFAQVPEKSGFVGGICE